MKTNRWYTQAMVFLAVSHGRAGPCLQPGKCRGRTCEAVCSDVQARKARTDAGAHRAVSGFASRPGTCCIHIPLEIVQADRFAKQNQGLKGDELLKAAKDKEWDPSVKAMLQFPSVLAMMSEKLDWTTDLGDAFLSAKGRNGRCPASEEESL